METSSKLSYSEDYVIFSSKWTVKDLMEAIQYQNEYSDEETKSMLDDEKIEELAADVNDAVQETITTFMNAYF